MQIIRTSVAIAAGATLAVGSTLSADARPLSRFLWKNRPLVIFSPTENDARLTRQRRIVAKNLAGFRERDMVVLEIVGGEVRVLLGSRPGASAGRFSRYYGVPASGFRTILVGKDGGRKLSVNGVVSADRLFRLIDSMPMRRDEMRRRR